MPFLRSFLELESIHEIIFRPIDLQGSYPTGEYFVKATINEDGQVNREFNDKFNRLIMSDAKLGMGWAQTFFEYDPLDNITKISAPASPGGNTLETNFE